MKKRLLCLMLLCSMVLSMLPVPVLAEDAGDEALVCICDTACTEDGRNPDCPVCGAEGAHLHDCALYEDAHEPEAEDEEPFEEEEPEEEEETEKEEEPSEEDPSEEEEQEPEEEKPGEEPSEEDPTEGPENPEQPQDESENEGEDGEPEDEEGLDNAVDTLELTGEDMIRVYSGEPMSDELYDSLSRVTFTLSASEYQCGEAGHTGSITDICINSVDLSDWDANRKIKVNFDISFQCDTPGCPRGKVWDRYDKTRTFTDSDSCHTPVSATANYRKACSSNNNDLIVLTLTSDKSIAYKEYFSEKEATCTEAGYEAYWMCGSDSDNNKCRKIFSDEECTQELTAPVTLPAKGHDFNSVTAHHEAKPATCVAEGTVEYWQCYQCIKPFADDKGTTELTTVRLPVDPDNHAQKPVYRVDELSHVADYACCNKSTSARHTFEGGSLPLADKSKNMIWGRAYGELPVPTNGDLKFAGWFTEAEGGTKVEATDIVPSVEEQILYAHWTANQKTIHVDPQSEHTKFYDGMTDVDLNRLAGDLIFRDESGNDVTQDVQGKFTVTEASFNSPNFFGVSRVTGKMEIREAYAAEFQLDKTEFTIKGKIDKAVPTLTGLELKLKKQLYAGDSLGWNFDNNNLSGGTATITAYNGSTVPVPGTFTFDEGELHRGSPLKGGENRLPVRFDPKDVANVEEAACEVVVNVPYRNYDCVSASYLYPAYGTAFKDLNLPDSVTVNARYDASDGGVGFNYYADITWDASKYDPTNLEEQIMYGTFDRSYWEDYIAFPEGADVRAKLVIKVQPPVQAETEITELPTFQWTKRLDNGSTFKLPVNTIFLFTKFKVGTFSGQTGTLTGGKARIKGTDTELSGTFALEFPYGQTETFYSEAGTKEVTVVFKPENSLFYAEARATLSVEAIKLTLAKMYNTVSITDKDVGTQFADLGLPTSVGFETEDGTVKFISVEWNAEGYNRNSSAEQTITGTLKYDSFDERELNPTTLTATATVKLIPPAHVHAYTQKVQKAKTLKTPASCTEDEVYYLSCECGEISQNEADVFIAENTALDHDFGDWTTNGDGKHTRTCKRYNCTASETDSCSGGTATCVEKAVCKACKVVYGELGAHVFSDEWTIDGYQHWHVCTVCRAKETERLNHFDQDDDHLCDTCGYQITDHTFGTDWSMDETSHWHACSMCGAKSDEAVHTDANKDHACDVCGKTISNHVDEDKDHICDYCEKTISNHVDENKDHVCDYCEKTISNHEDADKDHVCDYCEKTISNHVDANKDHICDYCEKTISNHEDENKDHICDYCEKTISNHVDANKDHRCDFCERLITNHADENRDHICDICEKVISNHTGGEATCTAKAVCELCGKAYGEKDPVNHTGENRWTADEKTHEREWTCCGVVTVETEAHTFGKWVTTVKPTSHKKGEKERTCEVCGYTQTKTVSPTGGSGTTDSGKKPATGTDDRLPFDDVRRGDWFYDDVRYVYETGLMNGTANRIFAPSVSTTRAMIVTILWRLEGSPVVNFAMRFRDVVQNAWYSEAVRWAAANGIVTGYTEQTFGPNDNIAREQLAAILHRYAKYKGLDVSAGEDTNILSFDDAQTISGYAVPAMQWACGAGLMQGSNRKLLPAAQATRAQVAAMLHRFLG